MPRLLLYFIVLFCYSLWIGTAKADCSYNGLKYLEGEEVVTAEPCLNCTCARSTLVCYLRMCSRLPNPPPPGCILLHRYNACCPDLICKDGENLLYGLQARSDDGIDLDLDDAGPIKRNACFVNGTVYSPGSAMASSTLCEYCYCLGGQQRCVKPKCLLPIEGCTPMYHPNSCCPVNYKCAATDRAKSTTTLSPESLKDSCLVANAYHANGRKIVGVGHSACDNCYCFKGLIRCEPLSCAPALFGCTPVIRPGECCAASYNCSGTIEARPEVNYGNSPTVSKDYAKLRKEASVTLKSEDNIFGRFSNVATPKSHRPYGHFGTTRYLSGSIVDRSTLNPQEDSLRSVQVTSPKNYPNIVYKSSSSYSAIGSSKIDEKSEPLLMNSISNKDLNLTIENFRIELNYSTEESKNDESTIEWASEHTTEKNQIEEATENEDRVSSTVFDLLNLSSDDDVENVKNEVEVGDTKSTTELTTWSTTDDNDLELTTFKTVLNSTDCIETVPNSSDRKTINNGDVTTLDLESKLKISTVTVHPFDKFSVDSLVLNKDNEDYDYEKPTLPPSLPNLKIIPFLASDAVDTKEEKLMYPMFEERTDTLYSYVSNSFTPPNKTESGFVPKDPQPAVVFYGEYSRAGPDENGATPSSTAPLTTPLAGTDGLSCLHQLKEYNHGEMIPSDNICEVCECYFGNVICHDYACPPIKAGCRKSGILERTTCCPHIICDGENAPSSVLDDRLEEVTLHPLELENNVSQNPFQDVIRAEPAPNLVILRDDMTNFIRRKVPTTTLTPAKFEIIKNKNVEGYSSDATETIRNRDGNEKTPNIVDVGNDDSKSGSSHSVGLLKLAGCNIYGRMYRVGRIISELSGPCLECKCTEVGVQCKNLC